MNLVLVYLLKHYESVFEYYDCWDDIEAPPTSSLMPVHRDENILSEVRESYPTITTELSYF
jgi:hypothetical protein